MAQAASGEGPGDSGPPPASASASSVRRAGAAILAHPLWKVLNSPIVIALLSALVLKAFTDAYAQRQAERADRLDRQRALAPLLFEYNQRIRALGAVDVALAFDKANALGADLKTEDDIVAGSGAYRASEPDLAGVSLADIVQRIDFYSNCHDRKTAKLFSSLYVGGDLRFDIHRDLDRMRQYGVGRQIALEDNDLPLIPGRPLSSSQRVYLGDPILPWSDFASHRRWAEELAGEARRRAAAPAGAPAS